ncbi:TonB family protein [candidate division FCPU426 bacterium]|nr:TonB family protein [candidate division FCPU426 bacterium]
MNKPAFFRWFNENKLPVTLAASFGMHMGVLFSFHMQAPSSRLRMLETTIALTDMEEQVPEPPKTREVVRKPSSEPPEEAVEQQVAIPPAPQEHMFLPFYKVETLPVFKNRVLPAYPEAARKLGRTSQVMLEAYIDAEGNVRQVRILRSGGGLFDQAAITALQQSRFTPALILGRAVPVVIRVPYVFNLENR